MSVEHSTLTGSDLHEPKGIASASTGQVYIANGSGSGTWTAHHNKCVLTVQLANISVASSCYIATPIAGTISKIYSVISAAITGGDAIITSKLGSTALTNGAITIANGSAIAAEDNCTPTANNTVTVGQAITLTSDGGSTNTSIGTFTIEITPS